MLRLRPVFLGACVVTLAVSVLLVAVAAPLGRGTVSTSRGHTRDISSGFASVKATSVPDVPTTTQPSPPYAVAQQSLTFVDPSRDTVARGDVPGHSGRTLVTDIFRPQGYIGPMPLVVFAHGWDSDPTVYTPLLEAWATAGYLVAAPVFPDSADTLPGSPVSNYPAQAKDISFLITQLLQGAAGPVDPNRIAVAGHSDGGTDVALLALNPNYADHRIRAYLSLSGEIPAGVAGPWEASTPGALLVVVGSADQYGLAPASQQVFDSAQMIKAMIDVGGGDHLQMYVDTTPMAQALREETVRFLSVAFRAQPLSSALVASTLEATGEPSFTVTAGPA